MVDTPDITDFCPRDGMLPPSIRALFAPAERRSVGPVPAPTPANDTATPRPGRYNPRLVIGARVAFLHGRREVEGRIETIQRHTGQAHIRLTSPGLAGTLAIESLSHLVPIGRDGRPL